MPQVYGLGISALGSATNDVQNDLTATDGGDLTTSGPGALSGMIADVPVAADPQVFRWGVGALSIVDNNVDSSVDSQVSGVATGTPALQIPVGLVPQVKDVTIPILADVINTGTDVTDVRVGEVQAAQIPVQLDLSGLLGGAAPLARDEQVARSGAPAPGLGASSLENVLYQVGSKPAEAVGMATGAVGAAAGETTGGVLGAANGATGESRAATPAPALPAPSVPAPALPGAGDLLPHIQQPHVSAPGVPNTPRVPMS
jgi:trimeric autotransporter adhesin